MFSISPEARRAVEESEARRRACNARYGVRYTVIPADPGATLSRAGRNEPLRAAVAGSDGSLSYITSDMDSALHCICGVAECAHLRACKEQFTMFVRPDHPQTTATAVIHILNDCIHVSFPEIHNAFNELVKSLGYRWKAPYWQRAINARAGTIEDRSAELAHRLLSAGFCVQFPNDLIQTKAIAGDYAHEHTRWILRRTSGEYADWFVFEWSRADDLYKQAMRLTGARYRNGNVIVPDNHYDEVLDFADHLGFRLTEAAQALADEARARWESALVVAVPKPKSQPLPDGKLRLPENLDIANELADHD